MGGCISKGGSEKEHREGVQAAQSSADVKVQEGPPKSSKSKKSPDSASSRAARKALQELLAQPDNATCADCGAPEPKWVSTNLGVFVCIKCSGVHRSMGTHISKMLSVTLDEWTEEQVAAVAALGGNAKVNSDWEAHLPATILKPNENSSVDERTEFIRRKYEDREFLPLGAKLASLKTEAGAPSATKSARARPSRASNSTKGMVEFIGLLKIHVLRGKNLAVRDITGTSDPYIIFTLGQQSVRTHVIGRNLNPEWNEDLMLSIPSVDEPLRLEVYDQDLITEDDKMGDATVDLSYLATLAGVIKEDLMAPSPERSSSRGSNITRHGSVTVSSQDVELIEGTPRQKMIVKLENVEKGEVELELEWLVLRQ